MGFLVLLLVSALGWLVVAFGLIEGSRSLGEKLGGRAETAAPYAASLTPLIGLAATLVAIGQRVPTCFGSGWALATNSEHRPFLYGAIAAAAVGAALLVAAVKLPPRPRAAATVLTLVVASSVQVTLLVILLFDWS